MKRILANTKIEGYSRAAEETYFYLPEFKIALDIGRCPRGLLSASHLFLTHLHLDHAAGLLYYIASRALLKMAPPKIFLPKAHLEPLKKMISLWEDIEETKYPLKLIPLEGGEEITLPKNLKIRALPTYHRLPSLGYTLYQKRKKLKEKFVGKDPAELGRLGKKGVEISEATEIPLLSFSGDTTIQWLDQWPEIFQSKILILECTFIKEKQAKLAAKSGHIYLGEIVERAHLFKNDHLVLSHFSLRYSSREIRSLVLSALPPDLRKKTVLWL